MQYSTFFVVGSTISNGHDTYLASGTYRITIFGYNLGYAFIQEKNNNNWITVFEAGTTGTFTIT